MPAVPVLQKGHPKFEASLGHRMGLQKEKKKARYVESTLIIPALWRLRQDDCLEAILDYTVSGQPELQSKTLVSKKQRMHEAVRQTVHRY